jgi:hypothetical protein
MERLHEKGYITTPVSNAKSIEFTDERVPASEQASDYFADRERERCADRATPGAHTVMTLCCVREPSKCGYACQKTSSD